MMYYSITGFVEHVVRFKYPKERGVSSAETLEDGGESACTEDAFQSYAKHFRVMMIGVCSIVRVLLLLCWIVRCVK